MSDIVKQWSKELKKVVRTMDVEKYRKFYTKWLKRGVYDRPLPINDRVIEIALHKMLLQMNGVPQEEKLSAEIWLIEHGCSTDVFSVGSGR
jgi:hypothetical protein